MDTINQATLAKIKQATHFLDEPYQKPIQLAVLYVEAQLMAAALNDPEQDRTAHLLNLLAPTLGDDKLKLVHMLMSLQGVSAQGGTR